MKKLLIGLTLLASMSSFAETFTCSSEFSGYRDDGDNYGVGIYDVMELECEGEDTGKNLDVKIRGYGPALRISMADKTILTCPFRAGNEVKGTYYGVKVQAAAILGVSVGLFYNKTQSCILTGAGFNELGASLVGAKMVIE